MGTTIYVSETEYEALRTARDAISTNFESAEQAYIDSHTQDLDGLDSLIRKYQRRS